MSKRNIFIVLVIIVLAGLGYFFFKPKASVSVVKTPTQFFSQDKILPTDTVVKITDQGFEPADINIKQGQRVVWINETSDFEWPASNPHPTHTDYPEFDPKEPLAQGEVWAFTFDRIGNWGYHNHMKPNDRGMVNVSL